MVFLLLLVFVGILLYLLYTLLKCLLFFKLVNFKKSSYEASFKRLQENGYDIGSWKNRMEKNTFSISVSKQAVINGNYIYGDSSKVAVFLHGFNQTKWDMVAHADYFYQNNFTLVFFDFRRCGTSSGISNSLGGVELADFKKVMHYINGQFPLTKELYLVGHSLGASVASIYAPYDLRVKYLVLDSLYSSARELIKSYIINLPLIAYIVNRITEDMGELLAIYPKFSIQDINPKYSLARTTMPCLLLHSDKDKKIDPSLALSVYQKRYKIAPTQIYFSKKATSGDLVFTDRDKYLTLLEDFFKADYRQTSFSKILY